MQDSLEMALLQRIALLAVIAFIFSHSKAFRYMFKDQTTSKEKVVLVSFFSVVGIAGTYLGIPIEGAIANFRDTGSIVGGLFGGPLVGGAIGLISGIHRMSIGGFTAVPCGAATIIGGMLAGYIHTRLKPKMPEFVLGVVTGVSVILMSMLLILATVEPFNQAWSLVKQITLPMALANAMGIAVFMIIIQNVREHQTNIAAFQTHRALQIANAALPYFRQGLTPVSAEKVAATILSMTEAAAVAITDTTTVLAHVGLGTGHHRAGIPIITNLTRVCLTAGQSQVAQTAEKIGCSHDNCPLKSAVVVPLFCKDAVVGAFKIYYAQEEALTSLDVEFAQGLGQIFSTQLELAQLQHTAELATRAELKALRAQIEPHFLFNALNTIVSFCRTKPEQARELIIELSDFFRRSLKAPRDFVTVREELEHVDSYLIFEKARFGERLTVTKEIEPGVLDLQIPVFTIQPLVENAVKHGLLAQTQGGQVTIAARCVDNYLEICIQDNGCGMAADMLNQVTVAGFGTGAGVGLTNVNERLKTLYGPQYALDISSQVGDGTTVLIHIPQKSEGSVA